MILYSLGVSLDGSLSAHAGQLATVRFLLRSSLGSLSELLAGCSRRGGGLSSGLLVVRHSERIILYYIILYYIILYYIILYYIILYYIILYYINTVGLFRVAMTTKSVGLEAGK